jgi:hypothetical protein
LVSAIELTEDRVVRKVPAYAGGFVGADRELRSQPLGAGQLSISSVTSFMIGGFVGIWIA